MDDPDALGLSKARRAGVEVPPPEEGKAKEETRNGAERALERGRGAPRKRRATPKRKWATKRALKREGTAAGTKKALSQRAKRAAKRRTATELSASAKKAARTKGAAGPPTGRQGSGSHPRSLLTPKFAVTAAPT